ncbi:MAG: hypothetical protein RL483_851 [Pseudomonadota bacterium]
MRSSAPQADLGAHGPDLGDWKTSLEQRLAVHLSKPTAQAAAPAASQSLSRLQQAMRHGVLNGGKRARGLLVLAAATASGADPKDQGVLDVACALELVHAFSLVHDDLPCMDDDDLRRGQPTVHVAFDEPTALLVGDALQTLAFECLAERAGSAELTIELVGRLAQATGALGMAGGQAIDIAAVGQKLDQQELEAMHRLKTGALISAAVEMGGCLGPRRQSDSHWMDSLGVFAQALGLAFQVVDDLLDASADTQTLGKTAGKDQAQGKPTFVSLMGLDQARSYARSLHDRALSALDHAGPEAMALRQMAQALTQRAY